MPHAITNRLLNRLRVIPAMRISEQETLIHQGELVDLHRTGQSNLVEQEILPHLVDVVAAHVLHHGWFQPLPTQNVSECLWSIQAALERAHGSVAAPGTYNSRSRAGVEFIRSAFPSYWRAAKGPAVQVHNKGILEKILRYRVGLNASKETFSITLSAIRRGFISGRRTVSMFKPAVAAAIYQRWLPAGKPVRVWDPSAGFGARMLGFFAIHPAESHYIANEPASMTHRDLKQVASCLLDSLPHAQITLMPEGSEVKSPQMPVDMIFTSPPYFDTERYFDEPGQCWRDYPTRERWVSEYLQPTIYRAYECLTDGGVLVLNVSKGLQEAVMETAHSAGFSLKASDRLTLPADHFRKSQGDNQERWEPVLVFSPTSRRNESERWKMVKDTNSRYMVSNHGRIKSFTKSPSGRFILGHALSSGYRAVGITAKAGGKSTTCLVHRLVAAAFLGPPPTPLHTDVCHKDGTKANNAVTNLKWGTRSENMLDVIKHRQEGKSEDTVHPAQREWYGGRTIDVELVQVCAELHAAGKITGADVGRLLNCSADVAGNILRRRTHKQFEIARSPIKKYRNKAHKEEIKRLIRAGNSRAEVNAALNEVLTAQDFYYYKTVAHKV
jgi:hypothetical protein